jgi:hypothetical protein
MGGSFFVRSARGEERDITYEGFRPTEANVIQLEGRTFSELAAFVGSDPFELVTDIGEEFRGCTLTKDRGWISFESRSDTPFLAQLHVAREAHEAFGLVGAEVTLASMTRHVERAEVRIRAQELLKEIERLKQLAGTDGQRRKAADVDDQWGRVARLEEELDRMNPFRDQKN